MKSSECIFLFVATTYNVANANTCAYEKLSGMMYNNEVEGTYDIMSNLYCGDRPIYHLANDRHISYMHFYNVSNYAGWLIGRMMCNGNGTNNYARALGTAFTPDQIQAGTWQEWDDLGPNKHWVDNPNVQVYCKGWLNSYSVVAIILCALLGTMLIVGLFLWLGVKYSNRHSPTVPASNMPPHSTAFYNRRRDPVVAPHSESDSPNDNQIVGTADEPPPYTSLGALPSPHGYKDESEQPGCEQFAVGGAAAAGDSSVPIGEDPPPYTAEYDEIPPNLVRSDSQSHETQL